jgi:predicted acyl esterase
LAYRQTCPPTGPAGAPYRAENWERLHPRSFALRQGRTQRIDSRRGRPATAKAIDPFGSSGSCATVAARRDRGTVNLQRSFRRKFTMLGMPTVEAKIRTKGRGGFMAARLWDVFRGKQVLVSRGVYRLRDNQRGEIRFQLFGNGWRFFKGHTAKLELLGRDPNFLRTSNFRFSVRVSGARVRLPGR